MRIDKFLNAVNLTKRRSVAQDMIAHGAIFINGAKAKNSKLVKVGDTIEFRFLDGDIQRHEVLMLPTLKSIPKDDKEKYVKLVQDKS